MFTPYSTGQTRKRLMVYRRVNDNLRGVVPPMSKKPSSQRPQVSGRWLWMLIACLALVVSLLAGTPARASEADLAIPELSAGHFENLGNISAWSLLFWGAWVICGTLGISL